MTIVEMKSGRVWWLVRTQRREFQDIAKAYAWITRHIEARRWYRYRVVDAGQPVIGGGNF